MNAEIRCTDYFVYQVDSCQTLCLPKPSSCLLQDHEDQTDTEKSLRKKQGTWIHEILKPKNLQ